MNARFPSAFILSATLHAIVAAIFVLVAYVAREQAGKIPTVLELVAGEGDNYMATEAPALGTPDGMKLELATPPTPKREPAPTPPAPKQETLPAAVPVTIEKAPAPKTERTFVQELERTRKLAQAKAKAQIAKERKAEEKRLEKERLTKEEFDRANRAKAKEAKSSPPKIAKIDAAGIAKGVLGGSTANTKGGAGGKALSVSEMSAVDAYTALLQLRLAEELDRIPGLADGLRAEAEVHITAEGKLTRARIVKSSGDETFDAAVLQAIVAVQMPPRPKGLGEVHKIPFSTHAKN
jgi:colicin import membrane protein